MPTARNIASFLDRLLDAEFADSSNNGLQVDNEGEIRLVCAGVDASLPFFEAAARRGANMVICHHGLSWQGGLRYITGLNYRRLRLLMQHNIALYASHLPLDAHPRVGNNVQLLRRLGATGLRPFGAYKGHEIGAAGRLRRAMSLAGFAALVQRVAGSRHVHVLECGRKPTVRTVAAVVGGGAVGLEEAAEMGADVYLSGEPSLSAVNTAREWGINAVFAGHYATEKFGVQALAERVARAFRVRTAFIDMGVEY